MSEQEIIEKLRDIFQQVTGREDAILDPKTKLKHLDVSSFAVVQLISAVEDAFHIEVKNRDVRKFTTVQSIVSYLKDRVK